MARRQQDLSVFESSSFLSTTYGGVFGLFLFYFKRQVWPERELNQNLPI